jgi:hypothetical protein
MCPLSHSHTHSRGGYVYSVLKEEFTLARSESFFGGFYVDSVITDVSTITVLLHENINSEGDGGKDE